MDAEWTRDRMGRWTHTFYNALRQVIFVVDPENRWTGYDWCKCGSLAAITDGAANRTSWGLDIQGRKTGKTYADGKSDAYAYEAASGRLKTFIDAKGQTTTYAYNHDNSLAGVTYTNAAVGTPAVSFTYDPIYLRAKTMADGIGTTTYAYNPVPNVTVSPALGANALVSIDGPWSNATVTYGYDEWGRQVSRAINGNTNTSTIGLDALGRLGSVTNALGTFTYAYLGVTDRLDSVAYPNGQSVRFDYFPLSGDRRLKQIKNLGVGGGANPPVLSQFDYAYDPAGQITSWEQANSGNSASQPAVKYGLGYDGAGQLVSATQRNTGTGAATAQFAYGYDQAANRTLDQKDSVVSTSVFNNLNQLTGQSAGGAMHFAGTVSEPGSTVTVGGSPARVDAAGNFDGVAQVAAGQNTVTITATDPSGNAATKSFQVTVPAASASILTYDLNGNLTNDGAGHTFEYDAADRCIAVNKQIGELRSEFSYDGLGRRCKIVEKTGGSVINTKVFVFDTAGLGSPAEERDMTNTVVRKFYANGEARMNGSTTTRLFYALDHLGSLRELTDIFGVMQARYEYGLWGRRTKMSGNLDTEIGFTGYWQHQTSDCYLSPTRMFDSTNGRFLSRDLLKEAGDNNLYRYASNSPLILIDVLGLKSGFFSTSLAAARAGALADLKAAGSGRGRIEYGGWVCKCKNCTGDSPYYYTGPTSGHKGPPPANSGASGRADTYSIPSEFEKCDSGDTIIGLHYAHPNGSLIPPYDVAQQQAMGIPFFVAAPPAPPSFVPRTSSSGKWP